MRAGIVVSQGRELEMARKKVGRKKVSLEVSSWVVLVAVHQQGAPYAFYLIIHSFLNLLHKMVVLHAL